MVDHSVLLEELQAGIAELTTSERWMRYLEVQSRFYSYSPNNVLLIALQRPNATRVAGYKTWQSLDHQVRTKESALRILAPMTYKRDDVSEGDDVREIRGFKMVPVFDISQTDGPDLPEAVSKLEGLAPEGVFERLTEFAHSIGFRVERPESLASGANGDTTHSSGLIRVVSTNSEAQQAKTLAHEIGHALLHDPESVTTKDLSRGLKELEAESTAYVICTALGMDTSDYSFGYVLGWTGGAPDAIKGIRASTGRIQRAATAVLNTFEAGKPTTELDTVVGLDIAGERSTASDITPSDGVRKIGDLSAVERDATPCVESIDVDRFRRYQPLSSAELEVLNPAAILDFAPGIGR